MPFRDYHTATLLAPAILAVALQVPGLAGMAAVLPPSFWTFVAVRFLQDGINSQRARTAQHIERMQHAP